MNDGFDAFLGDQAFEPGPVLEAEKLQIRVATAEVRDVDRRDRVAPGGQKRFATPCRSDRRRRYEHIHLKPSAAWRVGCSQRDHAAVDADVGAGHEG